MPQIDGPVTFLIPERAVGVPHRVHHLQCQIIRTNESWEFIDWMEFPVSQCFSGKYQLVQENVRLKSRAVFGYISFGYKENGLAVPDGEILFPFWDRCEFINWANQSFFPDPFKPDPDYVRIWLRKGCRMDWELYLNDEIIRPGIIH